MLFVRYDDKLREVIRLILFDTEGRFDECLVAGLYDNLFGPPLLWALGQLEGTYEHLRSREEAERTDVNIPRLLRLHSSLLSFHDTLREKTWSDFHFLAPCFIKQAYRGDSYCTIAFIDFINNLLLSPHIEGYQDIVAKRYDQPVEIQVEPGAIPESNLAGKSYFVRDCFDFMKYCLLTNKNYRVLKEIGRFTKIILEHSYVDRVSVPLEDLTSPFDRNVRLFIDSLMLSGNHRFYVMLNDQLHHDENEFHECKRKFKPQVRDCLETFAKTAESNQLIDVSALMSSVSEVSDTQPILDLLWRTKNLGAMIAYATNNIELAENRNLLKYTLYPILSKCVSEDAQVLIPKLFLTREEKIFIDNNMNDKYLISCLNYVDRLLKSTLQFDVKLRLTERRKMLLLQITLEYLKCNQTSSNTYKNILSCLSMLGIVSHTYNSKSSLLWIFELIESILDLIKKLDVSKPHHKPLIIGHIRLLSICTRKITSFRNSENLSKKVCDCFVQVVALALDHEECDILYEFVLLFNETNMIDRTAFEASDSDYKTHSRRYVELVWNHIKPIALSGDDQEMLGRLTELVIEIDTKVELDILSKLSITRHRDVPRFLGDVLRDYTGRVQTIEIMIQHLKLRRMREDDGPLNRESKNVLTYARYLDMVPNKDVDALDHLVRGFCLAMKSDCDSRTRYLIINELDSLQDDFRINEADPCKLMERLARTGILTTLHDVADCRSYCFNLRTSAHNALRSIKTSVGLKIQDEGKKHRALIVKGYLDKWKFPGTESIYQTKTGVIATAYTDENLKFCIEPPPMDVRPPRNMIRIPFGIYVDEIYDRHINPSPTAECY